MLRVLFVMICAPLLLACSSSATEPGPKPPVETGELCTSHLQCGSGNKCELGRCKSCEGLDCAELKDGGAPAGDMADRWNPNLPAVAISACKGASKGYLLTAKVAACQNAGLLVDQVCNDTQGWAPCQANVLGPADCAAIPWGFFGSRQHGRQATATPDATMVCTWNGGAGATSTEQRFIFGCGKAPAMVTYDIAANPCGGFNRALPCHGSPFSAGSTWDCPYFSNTDQDADRVSTTEPKDGQLCCRP
jgi:hypothetical protein